MGLVVKDSEICESCGSAAIAGVCGACDLPEQAEGDADVGVPYSETEIIPLRRKYALPRVWEDVDNGEVFLGDGQGEHQDQAWELYQLGFLPKAQRLAFCGRRAKRVHCLNPKCRKEFKKIFRCGLRSCPSCGPKNFAALFAKYSELDSVIPAELKCRPQWGWKTLTLSFRHDGTMPAPERVRWMNRVVRDVLVEALGQLFYREELKKAEALRLSDAKVAARRLARGLMKQWGAIRASEFGFDNVNYHFHLAYFGPHVPQQLLSRIFRRLTKGNSYIVWIERAKGGVRGALAHALKYTEKMPFSTPEGLARFEASLHRTRRVQTMGMFYNARLPEPQRAAPRCPECRELVAEDCDWVSVDRLAHLPEFEPFKGCKGVDAARAVRDGP